MNDNTPAFISPGAFEIDGTSSDGVITANHNGDGRLEIIILPLRQPHPIDIRVVLDEQDLESVNALLRQQAAAEEGDDETDA